MTCPCQRKAPETGGLFDFLTKPLTAVVDAAAGGPQKRGRIRAANAVASKAAAEQAAAEEETARVQAAIHRTPAPIVQAAPAASSCRKVCPVVVLVGVVALGLWVLR